MSRTGTLRPRAAIMALEWFSSVMRNINTSIACASFA